MMDDEEKPDEDGEIFPPDLKELLEVEFKFIKIQEFKRPDQVPLDLEQIHKLAAIMATQKEIAAFLGISLKTFTRRLEDTPDVRNAYDSGRERFRMTLRRRMVSVAMSRRNDAGRMCIWLSKQELGMSDRSHIRLEDGTTPGMSEEHKRQAMAELMGEDPSDPDSGTEDDGEAD